MNTPLISCLMATHGRAACVRVALACYCKQDYENRELVILNNHPTPMELGTHPDIPKDKVRIINQSGFKTVGACRNALLGHAKGELIRTWDDDDLYLPWTISQGVKGITSKPKLKAWKPSRSWTLCWKYGKHKWNLDRNNMEASITFTHDFVADFEYRPTGGDEHCTLLEYLKDHPSEYDTPDMGLLASYVYRYGFGLQRLSPRLVLAQEDEGVTSAEWLPREVVEKYSEDWMKRNQDVGIGPLLPDFATLRDYWQSLFDMVNANTELLATEESRLEFFRVWRDAQMQV